MTEKDQLLQSRLAAALRLAGERAEKATSLGELFESLKETTEAARDLRERLEQEPGFC